MNRHPRHHHRPAAQVLEDLARPILSSDPTSSKVALCDQLLAAAVYAERVSQTLTWASVNPDVLREAGDIATGRVLLGTLNPTREVGDDIRVVQLKAARQLITAAMNILDGVDTLLDAANALGEMMAAFAEFDPDEDRRCTPAAKSQVVA